MKIPENSLKLILRHTTEKERLLLYLRVVAGFSGKELALLFGTTASSVESMIHRAKKKVRIAAEKELEAND